MLGSSNIYHQFRALGYRAIILANWKQKDNSSQLVKEARHAEELLFQASTVFPFVLFPDTLTIDRVKVTITSRFFFATAQVTSISFEDLLNVEATVGPFFGSLTMWSKVFTERADEVTKPLKINFLSRSNVLEAERILQGAIIASHKQVDTSEAPKSELLMTLRKFGRQPR